MRHSVILFAACLVSASAGAEQALTTFEELGAYELAYPYPSPDEKEVVFQGNLEGRFQLYVMSTESGKIRRLIDSPGNDIQPSWSPDGEKIAFISDRNGNDDIFILDIATGSERAVDPHPGRDGHPKWSADGGWLYFNRVLSENDQGEDATILRMRPDGSDRSIIASSPNDETFPSPSPDGRRVAFVEWIPMNEDGTGLQGDIVVVDIQTGARRNFTQSPEFDAYPAWSPNGDWIYYSTFYEDNAHIFRVRLDDGTTERFQADQSNGNFVRAIPSADGERIYFNRDRDSRVRLFRAPAEFR